MDDEHVVAAGVDARDAAHGAAAGARRVLDAREVARAVADHRAAGAVERREDELARLAVGERLERLGVDDLRVEVVLEDVQARAVGAVAADAGAGDLGEAVDVVRDEAGVLLDLVAHLLGPGLGAEDAVLQGHLLAEVDALLVAFVDDVQEVARRARDRGDAEVLHQHQLAVGVAAGDGQHRAAVGLGAVVQHEAAGEEAVAVGDLHDVVRRHAGHREAAHHAVRPDGDVVRRVRDADRLAGGAGGAVVADDLAVRRRLEAGRVLVPQVGLHRERQELDVLERLDVLGLHAALVAALAEERDALVGVLHDELQAVQLQRAHLVDREVVERGDGMDRRGGVGCVGERAHGRWVLGCRPVGLAVAHAAMGRTDERGERIPPPRAPRKDFRASRAGRGRTLAAPPLGRDGNGLASVSAQPSTSRNRIDERASGNHHRVVPITAR